MICDLTNEHYEVMKSALLSHDLKINDLIKKARTLLLPTGENPIGRYYWLARGWSLAVAQAKIVEARKHKKPKISPFSAEFWLERVNPNTSKLFTQDEAEFKRNSLRPIRKEYWIDHGFSLEESIQKAKESKDANNNKGALVVKNRNKDEIKSFSPRCAEYWIARGYSELEAALAVKENQATFSKDKCKSKHGEVEGQRIWEERQEKWLATLNSKSPEELVVINKKKVAKGFNSSEGEMYLFAELNKIFQHLEEQVYIRDSTKKHGWLFDIGLGKKLIEYNGTYWHADPRHYSEDRIIQKKKMSAGQIWENDRIKSEVAKSQGYEILVIWEHDFKENKQREIDKCINFLTQ